ncbi:hypothetical protein N1851_015983 [Merluccius polli]|uniref:Uncharacterized protein n=1 Tax=Merluccius polli TaxID=89951 RepID=A0AA47MRV5_MERPO|nr:hypothetical protein N1851_015983 [Merluccius polli]
MRLRSRGLPTPGLREENPPKPEAVFPSVCSDEYNFMCVVDTAHLGPVTYQWKMDYGDWFNGTERLDLSVDVNPQEVSCKVITRLSESKASSPTKNGCYKPDDIYSDDIPDASYECWGRGLCHRRAAAVNDPVHNIPGPRDFVILTSNQSQAKDRAGLAIGHQTHRQARGGAGAVGIFHPVYFRFRWKVQNDAPTLRHFDDHGRAVFPGARLTD